MIQIILFELSRELNKSTPEKIILTFLAPLKAYKTFSIKFVRFINQLRGHFRIYNTCFGAQLPAKSP
jgi:hypothetical protein